jgi:uncharacterized iron-regulated membrane protein
MTLFRRAVFQIHLWIGIAAGLYIFVVCASGAVLVFRFELQRASYPALLTGRNAQPTVDMARILEVLQREYPTQRIAGVDAPTASRSTYLAYLTDRMKLRTVLLDAGTAQVLGELPGRWAIRTLQELHFHLLAGSTGTAIHGIGALCLLVMCVSGGILWWRGGAQWWHGLTVDFVAPQPQLPTQLHRAVGIWTLAFLALTAITALSFTYPRQFRAVVSSIAPLTPVRVPSSDRAAAAPGPGLSWASMIAGAERIMPGRYVARIVLPVRDDDTLQVFFANARPAPAGMSVFDVVYVDRYTGLALQLVSRDRSSPGDAIVSWLRPLHVGDFGGLSSKLVWLLLGLVPPLLFVTGALTWWRRVMRSSR